MFFQWRASRSGAEKFHSAMLPHGGTGTRVWAETVELGRDLQRLAPVVGSTVKAEVALLWDWESFWAQDLDWRPSVDLDHRERVEAFYTRLWQDKVTADFAHPEADLSGYRLVVVPQLYLLGALAANNLHAYVADGGHLLASYFSGVVDAHDRVHPEGLSGPLGKVLGVDVQELAPLRADERVTVEAADVVLAATFTADVWTEHVAVVGDTDVVARFRDGPAAGEPALTRRTIGDGTAWYLATRPTTAGLMAVVDAVYAAAGIVPDRALPADLDVVERSSATDRFQFLVNHSGQDAVVATSGVELVTGTSVPDTGQNVPAGTVRVVRRG